MANIAGVGVSIEKRSKAARGPLTPPNAAFAIWGPIFAATIAYAGRAAKHADASAANGWAALAFLGNTLWALEAQLRGLTWRSVAIIGATATAASAGFLQASRRGDRWAANALAGLSGWLTVATATNLESALIQAKGRPSPEIENTRALVLAGAASGVSVSLALLGRGNPFYAAAVGWGLGGVAVRSRREGRDALALVAAAGATAVALASLFSGNRLS